MKVLLDKGVLSRSQSDESFINELLSSEDATKFIKYVIKSYTKSPEKFMLFNRIEYEELMHIGRIGLYKGIVASDLAMDEKEIQRYLYLRVQGEVREVSRSNDSNQVSVSQRIRSLYPKYLKFHQNFYENYFYDPGIREVMNEFDINEEDAYDLIYGMQASISHDAELKEGSVTTLLDLIPRTNRSVEDQVIRKMVLEEKLALLGLKERRVIEMKYLDEYNNTEIAKVLGCANSMVTKYLKKAFSVLGIDPVKVPQRQSRHLRV